MFFILESTRMIAFYSFGLPIKKVSVFFVVPTLWDTDYIRNKSLMLRLEYLIYKTIS
jgi:hypothetical protein